MSATVRAWSEGTARSSLGTKSPALAAKLAKGVDLLALDIALEAAGCQPSAPAIDLQDLRPSEPRTTLETKEPG